MAMCSLSYKLKEKWPCVPSFNFDYLCALGVARGVLQRCSCRFQTCRRKRRGRGGPESGNRTSNEHQSAIRQSGVP
eukprot:3751824-Alexandrium_andersonii.AAC.1